MITMLVRIGAVLIMGLFTLQGLYAQEEDIQQIYQEYMQINMRLQQVQDQAMNDEIVAEEADNYSSLVDEKVKSADPNGEGLLMRRDDTISKYQAAQLGGDTDEMARLEEQFTTINSELQPLINIALNDAEVIEKRDQFEKILIAKMEEIDPETDEMIQRITVLAEVLEKHFNN
jgi:hypothetical protein